MNQTTLQSSPSYLVSNGNLIDGTGSKAQNNSSVLIDRGVIYLFCALAEQRAKEVDQLVTVDAAGGTIMPGLIDCHCHISFDEPRSNDELFFHRREGLATLVAAANARKVLRAGVTSFFDANCIFDVGLDLRDGIEGGVVEGRRMATGGNVLITSVAGTAGRLLPESGKLGYAVMVETIDDIVREVRRQAKKGVDWIKVHVSGLPTRRTMLGAESGEVQAWRFEELKAVCDVAHSLGLPVVGHCRDAQSTYDATAAGFDMLLHATYMDERALEIVSDKKIPIVPTLTFQANLADFGDRVGASPHLQKIFRDEIQESSIMLRKAFEAGVPILSGSESGFSIVPYGQWHYRELELFVENLGMTPLQAIRSATQEGGRVFGLDGKLGAIKESFIADVLVVNGDPSADLKVLAKHGNIKHIFKNGLKVDQSQPLAESWQLPGWRVVEFSSQVLTNEIAEQ